MSKPWFDSKSGILLLDEYVVEMPSFQRICQDEVITEEELQEHVTRTTDLLRKLENMLSPEAKAVATEALCELAVMYSLQRKYDQAGI